MNGASEFFFFLPSVHSVIVFVCLRARGEGVVIAAAPVSHMGDLWGEGVGAMHSSLTGVCVCQKDSNDGKETNYSIQ